MVYTWRKTDKVLFNLEKQKAINTTVRHLINDDKDITDLKEITLVYANFTKIFLKAMSLNQIQKGNRF